MSSVPSVPRPPRATTRPPAARGGTAALLALTLLPGAAVHSQDLEPFVQRLAEEREQPYAERVKTITAIGLIRTDEAAAVLEALYDEDRDDFIRSAALYALAACGTPRALRRVEAVVLDADASSRCRCAALDAFVRTRGEDAFDLVREITRTSKGNYDLRIAAYTALGRYPLERTESLWRSVVHDAVAPVRALAFKALAPLKDQEILKAARKAMESSSEHTEVRTAAIAAWGAAGGPEGTRLLLAYLDNPHPQIRGAVAKALASLTNGNDISLMFSPLARHPDPVARALIAGALGRSDHPGVVAALEKALRDKHPDVRLAAIESLGRRPEPKAELILQSQARSAYEDVAVAAVGALAGHASDTTLQLLSRLATSRKLPVAVAAIDALGQRGTADAVPVLAQALKNRNWSLRAAAIRALGRFKTRETIDLLVAQLGKEEGRLRADIVDVLRPLTGRQLPYDATAWKTWWDSRRETFDPDAPPEEARSGDVNTVAYYGIPVLSKRVVFCLDISSSMTTYAEQDVTRMDQAKEEIKRTLSALDGDVRLNIIFFDDKIQPLGHSLVPIRGRLQSILRTVGKVQPRGATNIYDTLAYAFQDTSVDTIFLLSDGEPTDGKYTYTDEILRRIRRINRARQVVIHTISFGRSEFMEALAGQNRGRYVERP